MTQYYGVTHPSQPNYIAQLAGSYFGINVDTPVDLPQTNLVDLLENKKISWKAYEEDYPGNCETEETIGKYWRKHNPFISFTNIQKNQTRCAKIVNAQELDKDLAAGTLPQFSYYTPNIDNDGHDTGLEFAGKFLHTFMSKRLQLFPEGTLIVITFDEDDIFNEMRNKIYTALLGSMIKPGTTDSTHYDQYSFTRTVEDNWDLGTLNRHDATATPYNFRI